MKLGKRIAVLLLTVVLLTGVITGCTPKVKDKDPVIKPPVVVVEGDTKIKEHLPSFSEDIIEKTEQNEDTVGWLQVPYTTISDVVVKGKDNNFYLRKNFYKEGEFNGVYYADWRNDFGDGSREDLPINVTIYGHALTDEPDHDNYGIRFGPLHDLRDPNMASENLYMTFSTEQEDFMYEIISVFVANSDNSSNPYNKGNAEKGTFHDVVRQEIIPRSLYDYGVEITDEDKFLTLSTCIYTLEDGTVTNYPNTYYRYAVMGRLVDPESVYVEKKELIIDEDRIVDPDGKWDNSAVA